jgi:arylsulfatase
VNRRDLIRNTILVADAVGTARASTEQRLMDSSLGDAKPSSRTSSGSMPNILWICADQQRADTIAALGNPHIRTPNLDKLVGQSTVFTNAFCQTPICVPSRCSFLTDRDPRETGLRSNAERIHDSERIVPRILADYGYDCGLVGKLHLSPADHRIIEVRTDDGYRVFEWGHDSSDNWPGKNQWRNWLAIQNVIWPAAPRGTQRTVTWGVPIDPTYTQTAWCGQEAIKFMREHPKDKAWLMSVNIYQPHAPFHPTEDYLSRYNPDDMPSPVYRDGELDNKPKHQQAMACLSSKPRTKSTALPKLPTTQ